MSVVSQFHMKKCKTAVFACETIFLYCIWCKYKSYELYFFLVCVCDFGEYGLAKCEKTLLLNDKLIEEII